jgi:hypothetical protein
VLSFFLCHPYWAGGTIVSSGTKTTSSVASPSRITRAGRPGAVPLSLFGQSLDRVRFYRKLMIAPSAFQPT